MLTVNFRIAPEPTGPACSMRRQSWSRIGLARAASAGVGAHQAEQLALPRRTRCCRRPDIRPARRPWRATFSASATGTGGRHRAHLDEQLALHVAREKPGGAVVDRVDRGGVGEDGDDRFGLARQFGRRRRERRAGIDHRLGLGGGAIPDRDLVADLHQPLRDRGPILPMPAIPMCMNCPLISSAVVAATAVDHRRIRNLARSDVDVPRSARTTEPPLSRA